VCPEPNDRRIPRGNAAICPARYPHVSLRAGQHHRALVIDQVHGLVGQAAAFGQRRRALFPDWEDQAAVNGVLAGREQALARDGDQPEVQAGPWHIPPGGDAGPGFGASGRQHPGQRRTVHVGGLVAPQAHAGLVHRDRPRAVLPCPLHRHERALIATTAHQVPVLAVQRP
jgi:hypothetical protein